tara:strand:+ start:402 stop:1025 length:624 start_codon:yes stop_codon:yes gene_type:complete
MAKPVNTDYHLISSTVDAAVELGKVNPDGVISAFKVTGGGTYSNIIPHYFQLDKSGDVKTKGRRGGTIFRGGGTFTVKHGDQVGEDIPGVYIDSGNGDLILKSSGRVKIIGENVDIIATGAGKSGNVEINAPSRVIIDSKQAITMKSSADTVIMAGVSLFLEGRDSAYLSAKDAEVIDGATTIKGSTGLIPGLGTIEEIKRAIRELI